MLAFLILRSKDNVFQLDHKGFSAKLFLPITFIPKSLVIWIISYTFAKSYRKILMFPSALP